MMAAMMRGLLISVALTTSMACSNGTDEDTGTGNGGAAGNAGTGGSGSTTEFDFECVDDFTAARKADGVETNCFPYRCTAEAGCPGNCEIDEDCAEHNICSETGLDGINACVPERT